MMAATTASTFWEKASRLLEQKEDCGKDGGSCYEWLSDRVLVVLGCLFLFCVFVCLCRAHRKGHQLAAAEAAAAGSPADNAPRGGVGRIVLRRNVN